MIQAHIVTIETLDINRLISYAVEGGTVKNILYEIAPAGEVVRLTQTLLIDSENEALIKGTQDELQVWLKSVGHYLQLSNDKSLLNRLQKWFLDRVWLRFTISERNIAMIMGKISILELALLLVLVLVWNVWIRI